MMTRDEAINILEQTANGNKASMLGGDCRAIAAMLRESWLTEADLSTVSAAWIHLDSNEWQKTSDNLRALIARLTPLPAVKWTDHTHYSRAYHGNYELLARESQTINDTDWVWHLFGGPASCLGPARNGFAPNKDAAKRAAESRLRKLIKEGTHQ